MKLPDWFFPVVVESIPALVAIVKTERCASAGVMLQRHPIGRQAYTTASGFIGSFNLGFECFARTRRGRRISYFESCLDWYGSERGVADADPRDTATVTAFLRAEACMLELRAMLPGVAVELFAPGEMPLGQATIESFRSMGRRLNLIKDVEPPKAESN